MSLIIAPTNTKVKGKEISLFMEQQQEQQFNFTAKNPQRVADEKAALALYHNLSKPIENYMDTIVTATGLKLKDVIGQYWFKTPDGLYVTQYFNTFDWLAGNRHIDPQHVAELINKIRKEGYAFRMATVNEKGQIIEGQHGLVAVSYLKARDSQTHPYIFHILPEAGVEQVEQHNSGRDEWDKENQLQSGIGLKIPTYVKIGELHYEKYKGRFAPSNIIGILCRGNNVLTDDFEKKRLSLSPEQFANAEKFLDMIVELHDTVYPERTTRTISSGWSSILLKLLEVQNFTFKRLLETIKEKENPSPSIEKLKDMTAQNKELICTHLIKIYNHKRVKGGSNYINVRDWQELKQQNTTLGDLDRLMNNVK